MSEASGAQKQWFGQPKGLSTLFFTEMWERFSYYGMRALLTLFMVAPVAAGGLGWSAAKAGPVYGLYTSMVYIMALPGGWVADRLIGQRQAVFIGGVIIALGHVSLMFHGLMPFYLGLFLVVVGTGLLKPNISSMVGDLYSEDDQRRDAGFSIFYMGINLGAFLAPLICGTLAQHPWFHAQLESWGLDPASAWHWGFGAAAVGMALGLVQYKLGGSNLGDAGIVAPGRGDDATFARNKRLFYIAMAVSTVILVGLVGLNRDAVFETHSDGTEVASTTDSVDDAAAAVSDAAVDSALMDTLPGDVATEEAPEAAGGEGDSQPLFVKIVGFFVVIVPFLYFAFLLVQKEWTPTERKRLIAVPVFFIAAALFWSAFEQAGSTLNLFADRFTDNRIFGWAFPSSYFQSVNSLFIILLLGPFFAWLWVRLGKREPSSPTKFAIGLFFVGFGFMILGWAALLSGPEGERVSPMWLLSVYFFHTVGEMCLSPVGLSTMTKLAPARISGQMMGVWFVAVGVGSYIGGVIAGFFESFPLPQLFGAVFLSCLVFTILMVILIKPVRRLMSGVH